MRIQITSYISGLSNKDKFELTKEIINNSTADLLLFSGHTIGFVNEIESLKTSITNKETEVIFELKDINSEKIKNCLYHIKNGEIQNLYTNQIFAESGEIENNYQLADRLLYEFANKRKFNINKLSFLVIQCGEMNILKNIQSEENRVEFRLTEDAILNERFLKILNETDVFLNPIHSPMGNQGKIQKRREFLSQNEKYYFSTSNTKDDSRNLDLKSLQYAFYNGNDLIEESKIITDKSISRIYKI
ncbi:MAG: hypothetical protein BWY38_02732 [Ignavibacteria bacterium ADurb.Bin266]|nr:MAG: hypothetical protein BWY38_02732 [Ignavibacteria bacterium ADurb.Bin266]